MSINQQLTILYENEIERLLGKYELPKNISGPNLMYCWEDEYLESEIKILFIGQEPEKYMGDLNLNVSECIKRYKDFELGGNGKYTTFWQYVYDTKNLLVSKSIGHKNFLWTNVSKFSKVRGRRNLSYPEYKFFSANFNVLEREIKITNPDVIIFFTGNSWDEKIQYQISDKIEFRPIEIEIDKSALARLTAKPFPYHTYRIATPKTLHAQKKWGYLEQIIRNINSTNFTSRNKFNLKGAANELIEGLSNTGAKITNLKNSLVKLHQYEQAYQVRDAENSLNISIEKLKKFEVAIKKSRK